MNWTDISWEVRISRNESISQFPGKAHAMHGQSLKLCVHRISVHKMGCMFPLRTCQTWTNILLCQDKALINLYYILKLSKRKGCSTCWGLYLSTLFSSRFTNKRWLLLLLLHLLLYRYYSRNVMCLVLPKCSTPDLRILKCLQPVNIFEI